MSSVRQAYNTGEQGIVELFVNPDRDPRPLGVRIDGLIVGFNIPGAVLETGEPAGGLQGQFRAALQNMRTLFELAGATLDNVARVTVFAGDLSERAAFDEIWDATFPERQDRPARKMMRASLPGEQRVQLAAFGIAGRRREVLDIAGVPARDTSVKIGDWFFSSRIHGTDPETSQMPEAAGDQARLAFQNIKTLVTMAGGGLETISQLTAFVKDESYREAIEQQWTQTFPQEQKRPAFAIFEAELVSTIKVMTEAIAACSPSTAGPLHEVFIAPEQSPIPAALRTGDTIFAPCIIGIDTETGALGEGVEQRLELTFRNLRLTLERAGASPDNLAHATVFMKDLGQRLAFNRPWVEMFPQASDRPSYKYLQSPLPEGVLLQLQVYAVAGKRRQVLEIPGMAHQDPMAMGVKIGDRLFSSRIMGTDTGTGRMGEGVEREAALAFQNMRTLLGRAGAGPENLTQVTAFVKDLAYREIVTRHWREMFPNGTVQQPRLQIVRFDAPGPLVRLEIKATVGRG